MNYFIDIPSFARFYATNDEDDEKPPPDLKTTENPIEERVVKKAVRRVSNVEQSDNNTTDENMTTPRKEKSSWPDWQFWKRSDGSSPFGSFRKSSKSPNQAGSFTFRKEINETKTKKNDVITAEPSNVKTNVTTVTTNSATNEAKATKKSEVCSSSWVSDADDPLVSYKNESNGSKHVVLNMDKIETLAGKDKQTNQVSNITDEKHSKVKAAQKCDPLKHGIASEQRFNATMASSIQNTKKVVSNDMNNTQPVNNPCKQVKTIIDEKPQGNDRRNIVNDNSPSSTSKVVQPSCEMRLNQSSAPSLEKGKLHNVFRKVNEPKKAENSVPQKCAPTIQGATTPQQQNLTSEKNTPIVPATTTNQKVELPEGDNADTTPRRHAKTSQKASRRHNVLHPGMVRSTVPQKISENATRQKIIKNSTSTKNEVGKVAVGGNLKKFNNTHELRCKPVMKDAWTITSQPCLKVDIAVQVGENGDLPLDETESLLEKRPWDTERVLKMQVLLDEKEVIIGKLKEAGRKQRDELKSSRKRCNQQEEIINQANMEGKPQLVMQINELTDIKNDLVEEISSLTVDIERERTTVKCLKNELMEMKAQLDSAKKRNANTIGQ